jgi:hypothetical protein
MGRAYDMYQGEDLGRDEEDNIKMNPKEIGWDGIDSIHLAQHRGKW